MLIKDINLGDSSGETEADFNDEFDKYYFDYNELAKNALDTKTFFIIGRKGTGKSLLARYIKKINKKNSLINNQIISLIDFEYQKLKEYKEEGFENKEYYSFWTWCLLVSVTSIIISENNEIDHDSLEDIDNFISSIFGLKINERKVIDKAKKLTISGGIGSYLKFSKTSEKEVAEGTYKDYIYDLENKLCKLVECSDIKTTIFLDDLDEGFHDEETYLQSMCSLITATKSLNTKFRESKAGIKIVLLIRSDIFKRLNAPNINLLKRDHALVLDWSLDDGKDSPLIEMIMWRIKNSISNSKKCNDSISYTTLFGQKVDGYECADYILKMGMSRPRDALSLLKIAQKSFPRLHSFQDYAFQKTKREYSLELIEDLRNEMYGHIDNKIIDDSFSLVKNLKSGTFTIDILREKRKRFFVSDDKYASKCLNLLFKFGVIGNIYPSEKNPNDYDEVFSHTEENAELEIDDKMVLHLGVRAGLRSK